MKRLAFFVEGQTELVFIEKLLREFVGSRHISIEHGKIKVGKAGGPRFFEIHVRAEEGLETEFYVMIYDCGGDDQVMTNMNDRFDGLLAKGYSLVIGLRDAKPKYTRFQVRNNIELINFGLKSSSALPVKYLIAVMEVEAWFIAEYTHFFNLHRILTPEKVGAVLDVDIQTCSTEEIDEPASAMNEIYKYAKKRYTKKRDKLQITVDHLDYALVCFDAIKRNQSLKLLISYLNDFFKSST